MTAKEATIELVTYRTDHIREATYALIRNFSISGISGTDQWINAAFPILRIIENEQLKPYSLSAPDIEISFSGFPAPTPKIKDGGIIYESKEPRFIIEDRWYDVLPRQRTKLARATSDIAHEMEDRFHMRIEYHPPYHLIFPKQEFAKKIVVFDAAIL